MSVCVCGGLMILLVLARRENRQLRGQLESKDSERRTLAPSGPAHKDSRQTDAAQSTSSLPSLSTAEIEPTLLKIIRDRLPGRDRDQVRRISATIDPKDMARALEIVDANALGQIRRLLRIDLLTAWARSDPAAASAWLAGFPATEAQRSERILISDIWSETDPKAALAFAGPTQGTFRNFALRFPEEAARAAMTVPNENNARAIAIEAVARAWFENDAGAAMKWATELPDSQDRFFGVRSLLPKLAETDPASVGAYVSTLPATYPFNNLTQNFAGQWAAIDPTAAGAWATGLASPALRSVVIPNIARNWAEDDPRSAAAWIASFPPSAEREAAAVAYVLGALTYDPPFAAEMATSIADETMRGNAIANVALRWIHADPAAAEAWLARITVPEITKQRLRAENFPQDSAAFRTSP